MKRKNGEDADRLLEIEEDRPLTQEEEASQEAILQALTERWRAEVCRPGTWPKRPANRERPSRWATRWKQKRAEARAAGGAYLPGGPP